VSGILSLVVLSYELEEQSRQAFSKVVRVLKRFMDASNQIAEIGISDLEERANQSSDD
jgi:hypothetical protein